MEITAGVPVKSFGCVLWGFVQVSQLTAALPAVDTFWAYINKRGGVCQAFFFITSARRGSSTAGAGLLLLIPGHELFEESYATKEIVGRFHYTDERIHAFVYNVGW